MTDQVTEGSSSATPSTSRTQTQSRSIDEFVPDDWRPDVIVALDAWKQGDLLEGSPRFWAGPAGEDLVIGTPEGEAAWDLVDAGSEAGYVVVTSQTCDIAGAGPGQYQPFIDVSPAVEITQAYSENKLEAILRWEVSYYAPLTAPPSAGVWVVDLRLSMPVSKGLLAERLPIAGFATEEDRLYFSEAIAARKRRPALHDALSTDLPRSLGAYIKTTNKNAPEWWQQVEQVRLRITGGDRLNPTAVGLIVCEEIPLEPAQRHIWRSWRNQGGRLLRPHRITLEPILFSTLDKLPARLYKNSVPLRLPELGRPPTW